MINIQENISLKPYTTFKIGGLADKLIFAQDESELKEAITYAKTTALPWLILGGGSNVLISDNGFKGVVIRLENIGMDITEETSDYVVLKVASGEIWDDVVRFAVDENWYGIENLSHIPGFMGGFAVQNVGAYGQEASQVVTAVEVFDIEDEKIKTLKAEECQFGYRTSIFNQTQKNRYIILNTFLKLLKSGEPNLSYGDLSKTFKNKDASLKNIREAIIKIRDTKFPFPDKPTTGNAGSFFRGPLLSEQLFQSLSNAISDSFGVEAKQKLDSIQDRLRVPQGYKTPTAFLLELCQLKNLEIGGAKINPNQPAIIINFTGNSTAKDVLDLYNLVATKVFEQTSVKLGIEPVLVGFDSSDIDQISNIFR